MARTSFLQLEVICFVAAAAIRFIAAADASRITSLPSTSFGINVVSEGKFREERSLAFIAKELNALGLRGGSDNELDGCITGATSEDEDAEREEESVIEKKADFGSFLSETYGVLDKRGEVGHDILGGTLSSALETAASQARLLVIFLPAKKPSKGKKTRDQIAIESMLSSEVAQAANKRARKKGGETGSFLFWGASAGSSEYAAAMKRLKGKLTPPKGEKRSVLAVAYPLVVSLCSGYSVSGE